MKEDGNENAVKTAAVIDIGSTAIRMIIAEVYGNGGWKIVENVGKPVPFGRDVFVGETIARETMLQALQVLSGFRELLQGLQIGPQNVHVIATNAIREARNRDMFIDRVALRTGFRIEVIEGIEQNHLTYIATQYALRDMKPHYTRFNSLIMEVGGGSTELMLLQKGRMVAVHSLRLGTVRIDQQLKQYPASPDFMFSYIQENLNMMRTQLDVELKLKRISCFIAIGGDARFIAHKIGKREGERYNIIQKSDFDALMSGIRMYSVDDCVREFHIAYHDAEGLIPALYIYKQLLDATSATQIVVPEVSIRDGVLINLNMTADTSIREGFLLQVIASALSLGRKYHFDEDHARYVSGMALLLFDTLQSEHGLDRHARLLLEVAALLHDIGTYVRATGHHKHGQYLVLNSDIFGLQRRDIEIISNAVRYHRRTPPLPSHPEYMSLSQEDRILVQKLSALLRVADGLDRGHLQKIRNLSIEKSPEELVLRCEDSIERSAERLGVEEKGDMFEEVFGMRVVLE